MFSRWSFVIVSFCHLASSQVYCLSFFDLRLLIVTLISSNVGPLCSLSVCNVTSYDPCWAMIWWGERDLVAMVRDRGLETFEFLCGYSVFVQVVPINSYLYEESVFILISSTRRDHYTFTVVSYRGSHYIVSYTIVKLFCSDLTFWFLVFYKLFQRHCWYLPLNHFIKENQALFL